MALCEHLAHSKYVAPKTHVCAECVALGDSWVHLRQCMLCGLVLCCDDSPMRHATAHNAATGHPIIRSLEPGEFWYWCYPDQLAFEL